MKNSVAHTFKTMGQALTAPEKTFKDQDYLKSSLFLLLLTVYLLTLTSALLSTAVMNRPEMQEFQLALSVRQAEKNMIGASEADREALREQIRAGMNSPVGRIAQYVSVVITSGLFLVVPLFFWGLQTVAARFFGGEETAVDVEKRKKTVTRKHRRSLFLSFFAYIPLGIYSLLAGLMIFFRDPDTMTNVLTMEELMTKMDVDFSLFGIFAGFEVPVFIDTILSNLTNPFYWWFFFISFFGMKEIWRLKKAGIITILALWIVFGALYAWGSYSLAQAFTA